MKVFQSAIQKVWSRRMQLSVMSATCVHAQQLFMLLLVATEVALLINGVNPVQAST